MKQRCQDPMQQQVDVLRALCPLRRHQHAVNDLRGASSGGAEMRTECGTSCQAVMVQMCEASPAGSVDWHQCLGLVSSDRISPGYLIQAGMMPRTICLKL